MVQDLVPRPVQCADDDHQSVLTHEMAAIEPSEIPSRTLSWKPLVWLSHIKCRSNDDRFSSSQWESFNDLGLTCPLQLSLDRLNSAYVTRFLMTLLEIICRLVKQSQQLLRSMIGLFINWGRFLTPWDTGLKSIKEECRILSLRNQRIRSLAARRSKEEKLVRFLWQLIYQGRCLTVSV
jgi:hypothetical protein